MSQTPGLSMRIYLLLLLFLVLWDGRAGLIRAETGYKATEGGNMTVGCQFYLSGSKKIFCKNDCNKENILVETSENSGRNGRYSIEYKELSLLNTLMYVTITNVTSSDSGQYQCVLERRLNDGKYEFRIEVTKDATSLNHIYTLKPDYTPPSFSVKTTAHIPSSTSVTETELSLTQAPVSSAASSGTLLFVGLTLAVVLILFSVSLMIMCWKKRTNKPKEPPVNTVYALPQTDRLYEEIPDNNVQSTSRPVEGSTVYTVASLSKSAGDRTSEVYSLTTWPSEQFQVESPTSEVHYSEVDLSKSSAPRCQTGHQQAIYSENTLYSTVSLPQL